MLEPKVTADEELSKPKKVDWIAEKELKLLQLVRKHNAHIKTPINMNEKWEHIQKILLEDYHYEDIMNISYIAIKKKYTRLKNRFIRDHPYYQSEPYDRYKREKDRLIKLIMTDIHHQDDDNDQGDNIFTPRKKIKKSHDLSNKNVHTVSPPEKHENITKDVLTPAIKAEH